MSRLLVLVALVGACAAMGWEKPEFCRELEYRMFQNLYKYIEGENMMEAKMEMTTPVLTQVEKIEDDMIRITLLFWMQPSAMVNGSAPAPVNEDVYLVNVPAGRVYVRQFTNGWWPWTTDRMYN